MDDGQLIINYQLSIINCAEGAKGDKKELCYILRC